MAEVVAMTVLSGMTVMAGLVWSIISSLLGNAVLHDDAVKDVRIGSSTLRFRQYGRRRYLWCTGCTSVSI